jgi:hypothetical protein
MYKRKLGIKDYTPYEEHQIKVEKEVTEMHRFNAMI